LRAAPEGQDWEVKIGKSDFGENFPQCQQVLRDLAKLKNKIAWRYPVGDSMLEPHDVRVLDILMAERNS